MTHIADSAGRIVARFHADPVIGLTLAVTLAQLALGLLSFSLLRHFWYTRPGDITAIESSAYAGIAGIILLYNIAVIAFFAFLSAVND